MLNYKIAEWLNTTGSFADSFAKLLIFVYGSFSEDGGSGGLRRPTLRGMKRR